MSTQEVSNSKFASLHEMRIDLRKVLGCFATGVTLVTTWHHGKAQGMTANAFTSVSLDPPLVLISVNKQAATCRHISESNAFAINILSYRHKQVAVRFAGHHHSMQDPFVDIKYSRKTSGSPVLHDIEAWIDCILYTTYDGGDHTLFLGRVLDFGQSCPTLPLTFYGGEFGSCIQSVELHEERDDDCIQ